MPRHYAGDLETMPMHGELRLPPLTLRETDLAEVAQWEVGGKYYLIIEVEQTAKRNSKNLEAPDSGRVKIEGDFQILSIKVPSTGEQEKMEKKAFEGALAKARSGSQ